MVTCAGIGRPGGFFCGDNPVYEGMEGAVRHSSNEGPEKGERVAPSDQYMA